MRGGCGPPWGMGFAVTAALSRRAGPRASRKAQTGSLAPLSSAGPGGRATRGPVASVWCCAGASRHNHVAGDSGPLRLLCAALTPRGLRTGGAAVEEPACRAQQDRAAAWSREQAGLCPKAGRQWAEGCSPGWSGVALGRALQSGASLSFLASDRPDGAGSAPLTPGSPAASWC